MRLLISGGCKNGKSSIAEAWIDQVADRVKPLYYLATMLPKDAEDRSRIEVHRLKRQGIPFETIEIASDIQDVLKRCDPDGHFLLDSTTALLENEMFRLDGPFNLGAGDKVASDLTQLLSKIDQIVIVSDYIFSDAYFYDDLTEQFRRALAHIDRTLASLCEIVLEISFGQVIIHKGRQILEQNQQLQALLKLTGVPDAIF